MKNCPKCNSENINKTGPFAQKIQDGKEPEKQSEQVVNYSCLDCGNIVPIKFSEDKEYMVSAMFV